MSFVFFFYADAIYYLCFPYFNVITRGVYFGAAKLYVKAMQTIFQTYADTTF